MCYDLVESVGSQEHWLWDNIQKKELISFVFYCLENPSIVHNFGTTGPIQVGFWAKCTSPNEHFNQIEKLKMSHVRLQTNIPRSHHIMLLVMVLLLHHTCLIHCSSVDACVQGDIWTVFWAEMLLYIILSIMKQMLCLDLLKLFSVMQQENNAFLVLAMKGISPLLFCSLLNTNDIHMEWNCCFHLASSQKLWWNRVYSLASIQFE